MTVYCHFTVILPTLIQTIYKKGVKILFVSNVSGIWNIYIINKLNALTVSKRNFSINKEHADQECASLQEMLTHLDVVMLNDIAIWLISMNLNDI